EWQDAMRDQSYAPASLATEGFIHCSTAAQVVETANRFFPGQRDLLIVCLDERELASPLRYEPPVPGGEERNGTLFPHLYGPLNLDAVGGVFEFPCDAEGQFVVPAALRAD